MIFVSLHAIEPTRPRGQRRVDGVESPRHRADAATEARRVDGVGRPKFDFHSGAAASRATTRRSRARVARAATSSSTSGTCSATSRRCRRRRRSAASRSRSSTAAPRVRRVQDLCCLPRCDGRGDGVPVGWVTPPHAVDRESSSTFASIPPPLIVYRAGHDGHHGPPLRVDGAIAASRGRGWFLSDFEAVRTESRDRDAPRRCRARSPSCRALKVSRSTPGT